MICWDRFCSVHGVEVVAMADVYSRRRDQAKSRVPGIQTFDDHRRLLDMKDIDAVIVASPLHIHARHFLDTLAAGKDLYSEKTMTWSIPEADKCLAAAKESNRVDPDRIAASEFRRPDRRQAMDQRRMGRQSHAGRILDEPQHASRQRPVGASGSIGLHRAERQLERVSQRPAGASLRSLPSSSTGACSGSFPAATAPRTWCTRLRGSWARSTCRCHRRPTCRAACFRKKTAARCPTPSR